MKSSPESAIAISRIMRAATDHSFESALGNRSTGEMQLTIPALVSTDDVKANATFARVAARLSDQGIAVEEVNARQEQDTANLNYTGKTTVTIALKRT